MLGPPLEIVQIPRRYFQFGSSSSTGKLYVTKAVFSSGVDGLVDLILGLNFPFVKIFCLIHR